MCQQPKFNENHKEFEPIAQLNPALVAQLEAEEQENGTQTNLNSKIVYDCLDPSPFYEKEPYFNEADAVDLGPVDEPSAADPQTQTSSTQGRAGQQKGSSNSLNQQTQ